jgi:thiamine pyrophosphokinase
MRYPEKLALWDDGILVVAMSAGQESVLPVAAGTTVSVISFQSGTLIHTEGLTYGLSDEPLRSATHGISNTAMTARPVVSVVNGAALACMEGGETWLNE